MRPVNSSSDGALALAPAGPRAALRKYAKIFRVSLGERMVYRIDFLLGTVLRFLPMVATILLWQAIYEGSGRGELGGFRRNEVVQMSDTAKREPSIDPIERDAPVYGSPAAVAGAQPASAGVPLSERGGLDQLSRVEEKLARVEEKFARSEALLLRLEATFQDTLTRFGGLARSADVKALEGRVRGLPGAGSIFVVALIAALIGAFVMLLALRFGIPGLLPALAGH